MPATALIAGGLALCVALSACSVGPAYHRPPAPQPDAWRTATAGQTGAWPALDWWRGFGSPTLDGYVRQALGASDDIAAAVARVQEAEDQAQIAGAPLYPSLSAGFNAQKARQL
ncbi:MAG TPA: hypothetical protein VKT19_04440, partial [Steroidobacteraceae bacterium]|nr:hypothetical protein [Steroidobacteraceae bacterium]